MEKELPASTSNRTWDDNTSTLAPTITSQTTFPPPSYTPNNPPPPTSFTTLLVTNSHFINIILSTPSNPETPLFFVTNSQWSRSKPSVTLSRGEKAGPVLGVLKLGWWANENVYGLPISSSEIRKEGGEQEMRWESLKKTSKWTHGTYEFVFQGRHFVWQRTGQSIFADQPDMECQEVGGEEVLAVYVGCQGWGRKRGRFYLRKGAVRVGGAGSSGGMGADETNEWGDWEIAVLLTGLGLIEAARRRARQRRGGGGG